MSSLLRRRRRAGERGAVLVEFAIIGPVLCMLIFGMIEYGLLFRDYLTVSNVTRTGARVASAAGDENLADYNVLQAVKGAAGALPGGGATSIDRIVVYKATGPDGTPSDPSCLTLPSGGVSGACNIYLPSQLSLAQSAFGVCPSIATGPDRYWCPTSRVVAQGAPTGTDYVGVWVTTNHKFLTGFFGSGKTITDKVVMRIEPKKAT